MRVASGSFNSLDDSSADLAVVSQAGTVSIFLNNANHTFTAPTNFPVGGSATSIAAGDLNNDGRSDLAVADTFTDMTGSYPGVFILLGDGHGSFTSAGNHQAGLAVNARAEAVTIGNVNGDFGAGGMAKQDIVVVSSRLSNPGNVDVLLGHGDGTTESPIEMGTGLNPKSVAVADLNNDGKHDIVVADSGDQSNAGEIAVFANQGNFNNDPNSPEFGGRQNFPAHTRPHQLVVGSFDGGLQANDVAVANFGSNDVSVLHNADTASVSLGAPTNYAAGINPKSLTTGDFNGDARPDLATGNVSPGADPGDVSVLLANAMGGFDAPDTYLVTAPLPQGIVAADLNGDGKVNDLATANFGTNSTPGDASVFLSTGTTPPPPPTVSVSDPTPKPVPEGNSGTTDVTFPVALSRASAQPVTVHYDRGGHRDVARGLHSGFW